MAAFRVGQRVRIIGQFENCARDGLPYLGREGAITGTKRQPNFYGAVMDYEVNVDGVGACLFMASQLSPLTDPGAESFIARIKKLGSEPVNDAPKVTVREGK